MLGRMHAALFVGEKRALKMDAEGARTAWLGQLGDLIGEVLKRTQCGIHRCSDGGGKVGCGSTRGEKCADFAEFRRAGLHHVVAGSSVKMHIKE